MPEVSVLLEKVGFFFFFNGKLTVVTYVNIGLPSL